MRRVSFSHDANKTFRAMPANQRRLIVTKMEQYAADPRSLANNVKSLKGNRGYLRLRVGDWRVVFREDGAVVAVVRIASRGSVYD
jgi:mRNA interferase RelE/StbE